MVGTWTFEGARGLATWPNGSAGDLTIQRFDSTVIIQRIDLPGTAAYGTVAQYTGTRNGDRIDGTVTWNVAGGPSTSLPWHARIGSAQEQDTWVQAQLQTVAGQRHAAAQRAPAQSNENPSQAQSDAALHDQIAAIMARGVAHGTLFADRGAPEVRLPPGASPVFATFHADVRALLQPETALTPEAAKLPCDAKADIDAQTALEIGKFAIRAAEYPRGKCWFERSAALGNVRAQVLLGESYREGWSVPKDLETGFKHLMKASADPWGAYFLEDCFNYGWGTPVDKAMALHIEHWMWARGQAVWWAIGADDAEVQRSFRRTMILLSPPRMSVQSCTAGHCQMVPGDIDQARLDEELRNAN